LSHWVAESILKERKVKSRAATLKYWVKVAQVLSPYVYSNFKKFRAMNNFDGLMSILATMGMTETFELERTWKLIPCPTMNALRDLKKLMDTDSNYNNYRKELRVVRLPCLPFLGIFLLSPAKSRCSCQRLKVYRGW
jgi:hypothetical protein